MDQNNRVKLFLPIGLFFTMAGLLVYGLFLNPSDVQSVLLDRPVPEFSQPGLYDGEGPYTSADLEGQITIINVWGSWCPPCHVEHPFLIEISKREEDIQFVGITYDYSVQEDRDFLADRGTPFIKNIVDMDGSLRLDFGVTGAPETFLVGSDGKIRFRYIGPIDFKIWDEKFVPILTQLRSATQQ